MFFLTLRPTKHIILPVFCAAAIIFVIIACICGRVSAPASAEVDFDASDNSLRVQYLKELGLVVSHDPIDICEIEIPETFDDVYSRYNELQHTAGFDLSRYHGDTCTRYTYNVHNYENSDDPVYANLLVLDGRIIGGDICSADLYGFMLPLKSVDDSSFGG